MGGIKKASHIAVRSWISKTSGMRASIRFQLWACWVQSGLGFDDVARKIGSTPEAVASWLDDDFNIDIREMSDFATALGVTWSAEVNPR